MDQDKKLAEKLCKDKACKIQYCLQGVFYRVYTIIYYLVRSHKMVHSTCMHCYMHYTTLTYLTCIILPSQPLPGEKVSCGDR